MRRPSMLFGLFIFVFTTFGECTALVLWRRNLDLGMFPWAVAWLAVGFASERGAVAVWLGRLRKGNSDMHVPSKVMLAAILLAATVVEIGIWYAWRWSVTQWDVEIAGLFLFLAIHALHARELATVRAEPTVILALRPGVILVSTFEALGATAWILLEGHGHLWLGRGALLLGLAIEHTLQGGEFQRATSGYGLTVSSLA